MSFRPPSVSPTVKCSAMKTVNTLLLVLAILAGVYFSITSYVIVRSISDAPETWMGGASSEATLLWVASGLLGGGFLALATLLAIFGLIWGRNNRRAAFWLLKVPGVVAFIFALLVFAGLIALMPDWLKVIAYPLGLAIPTLLFWMAGTVYRKLNPRQVVTVKESSS